MNKVYNCVYMYALVCCFSKCVYFLKLFYVFHGLHEQIQLLIYERRLFAKIIITCMQYNYLCVQVINSLINLDILWVVQNSEQ